MKADMKCLECCRNKVSSLMRQYRIATPVQAAILEKVDSILQNCDEVEAPVILANVLAVLETGTGIRNAYEEPKRKYNEIMMQLMPKIKNKCRNAEDPFTMGIRYALTGNYIDFGAMSEVDEEKLYELLGKADTFEFDDEELSHMQKEIACAKRLVYFTDNAGEIVLDKMLIGLLCEMYPELEVAVVVRDYPVLNDATLEDATLIGMQKIAKVMTNGTQIPGTVIDKLPIRVREWVDSADVMIAKGQGNFETLRGCNRNIYYLFLCKCDLFVNKFGVERLTPVIKNEKRIILFE